MDPRSRWRWNAGQGLRHPSPSPSVTPSGPQPTRCPYFTPRHLIRRMSSPSEGATSPPSPPVPAAPPTRTGRGTPRLPAPPVFARGPRSCPRRRRGPGAPRPGCEGRGRGTGPRAPDPVEPMSRFIPRARRMARAFIPDVSTAAVAASTTRWTWFPWTLKRATRNPGRSAAPRRADATTAIPRRERRLQTWGRTRSVTWTGWWRERRGRATWGSSGSAPFGFLPAPGRRPPRAGRGSAPCASR